MGQNISPLARQGVLKWMLKVGEMNRPKLLNTSYNSRQKGCLLKSQHPVHHNTQTGGCGCKVTITRDSAPLRTKRVEGGLWEGGTNVTV